MAFTIQVHGNFGQILSALALRKKARALTFSTSRIALPIVEMSFLLTSPCSNALRDLWVSLNG